MKAGKGWNYERPDIIHLVLYWLWLNTHATCNNTCSSRHLWPTLPTIYLSSSDQSWDSSVRESVFDLRHWKILFSSVHCQDGLWESLRFLSNGCHGFPPSVQGGRGLELNTHLHLVPRLRTHWAEPLFPLCDFLAWCLITVISDLYFVIIR